MKKKIIDRQNEKNSNRDKERIDHYKQHRNKVGEALLRSALRALGSIDAGDMVADILQVKYNLSGVSLEKRELDTTIIRILRAEVAKILTDNSILSKEEKDKLLSRIIAQIAPTRDNISHSMSANSSIPKRQRIEDLHDLIKQEGINFEKNIR